VNTSLGHQNHKDTVSTVSKLNYQQIDKAFLLVGLDLHRSLVFHSMDGPTSLTLSLPHSLLVGIRVTGS